MDKISVNVKSPNTVTADAGEAKLLQGPKGDPFTYEDFTPEQLAKLEGAPGKSAYEFAVDGGYAGSESKFYNELGHIDNIVSESASNANDAAKSAREAKASAGDAAASATGAAAAVSAHNGSASAHSDIREDIAKLASACGLLPPEYTPLEYIESSGTQLIRTGVYGYADGSYVRGHRWEFDIEFTNNGKRQIMGYGAEGREYWGVTADGYYENGGKPLSTLANSRNIVVHDYSGGTEGGNYVQVGDETYVAPDHNVLTTNNEYTLFGVGRYFPAYAKIYRCKCYKGTTLIRDYVPCKNASGAIGLYDLVNDKFYGNAGTGAFAGKGLPSGYTRLDYIESTGKQYIKAGFVPNQDTRVVMDFDFVSVPTGEWATLFGARTQNTNGFAFIANKDFVTVHDVYKGTYSNYACAIDGRHIIDKNKNQTIVDGNVLVTHEYAEFTANIQLFLFVDHYANRPERYAVGKLYYCQIYDNGTLVRDYIPCRNENGVVGLYDLVNGVFYGNAGTGEFIGGTPEEVVELVSPNGTRYRLSVSDDGILSAVAV